MQQQQGLESVLKPELHPHVRAQIIRNGKNGFFEDRKITTALQSQDEAVALRSYNRSQFILKEDVLPWLSIEDVTKSARSEWTIPALKLRIAELKREHRQQLAKAIMYMEYEHAQLMNDEYLGFDPMTRWKPDVIEHVKSGLRVVNFTEAHHSDDFISTLRHAHIVALKPLYEKLQHLLMLEEKAKQQRARRFPKSSQGWREMDTRDAKLKVAKFLLMDKKKQDEIIHREVDWRADRADIDRVVLEFTTNIMFSEEVKNFVKNHQTTDPRRRG